MLGCWAFTSETLAEPELKVPVVKFKAIGEYSAVPVLSPTGNVKAPVVEKFLMSFPAPDATIILDADGLVMDIEPELPMVRLLDPRTNEPLLRVSAFVIVRLLFSVTFAPPDLSMVRLYIAALGSSIFMALLDAPLRITVPLFGVNVPLDLVQFPCMVSVGFPVLSESAPPSINKLPVAVRLPLRRTVPEVMVMLSGVSVVDQEKSPLFTS